MPRPHPAEPCKSFGSVFDMQYFVAVPYLLQICGLFPFSSQVVFSDVSKTRYNYCFIVWTLLGIIVVLVEWVVGFSTNIFSSLQGLQLSIEVMKFITNTGSHLLSLFESWITRRRQESIWKMNVRAERLLNKSDESMQNACFNRILRTFVAFLVVTVFIEVYYIAATRDTPSTTNAWYVNVVSTTVCRIRYLQHIMYTTLLAFWFSSIKEELKELSKSCKSESKTTMDSSMARLSLITSPKKQRPMKKIPKTLQRTITKTPGIVCNEASDMVEEDKRALKRLDILKDVYNMLFEVSEDLNSCFGIAQLANLLDNFVQLTCDFYWVYVLLANNQLYNLAEEVLVILPTIIILILLLSSCEKCLEEVRYIGFYLHEIERDSINYDFDLLVENFALQVLTERFEFSVAGFLSMSFNLLQEMFGAITTYMVILIQFTPNTGKTTTAPPARSTEAMAVGSTTSP